MRGVREAPVRPAKRRRKMNVQAKPNLGAAQRRLPFKWQR